MEEELEILEEALLFFEKNGEKYGLESMKTAALFDTVRLDLAREIDLLAEQRNLIEAKDIFQDNDRIVIPQLQNFCSHRITAMEYIAGTKITETHLPISKRRDLASLIFEAIICIPLFHQNESSLFHGDPHAGNLLAVNDTQATRPAVALLDWTLAGHLSRNTRMNLMNLLIGIVGEDIEKISEAIEQLAEQDDDRLSQHLHLHMSHPDYNQAHPLRRSFWLLEKLTMDGMLFSAELILFRKAFFTLEGVLEDLCPGFAMNAVMEKYLSNMILKEMPKRLFATISFQADDSGDYQSMLSNEDLGRLTMQQSITAWQQMMKNGATLVETQAKLNNDFLNYFNWFYR